MLIPCLALAAIVAAGSVVAEDSPIKYTVLYTGRLLGYARTPDRQVMGRTAGVCSAASPDGRDCPSPAAVAYFQLFEAAAKEHKDDGPILRLGMCSTPTA